MKGIVVAPQVRACDIGIEVLSRGGNAFDAAVATAFAQEVDDPLMCGLGGMGVAQLYHAASGAHLTIEFHGRGGARCRPDMYARTLRMRAKLGRAIVVNDYRSELGYQSIMTPGTVAGLGAIHARFGTLPWADLLAPAAALARSGMWVMPYALEFWNRLPQAGLADGRTRLSATEECRNLYVRPDGSFHPLGSTIPNPGLGDTLEALAGAGADDFYRGALGARIAEDMEANDALVTGADLEGYRCIEGKPLHVRYRGYDLYTAPPPASGLSVLQILRFLEPFDLAGAGHNSVRHLDLLIRAMTAAQVDRYAHIADPLFAEVPVARLLSEDHAAAWRAKLLDAAELPQPERVPDFGTTHISAADAAGNVVSMTHTLGTASGVITPGMGFVYNNSMKLFDPNPDHPNAVAAGKARTTAMSPTMVFRDGKPLFAVGAPGGSAIISSVSQTLLNLLDFGMSPAEAVVAPRIHAEGGEVLVESRVQGRVLEGLKARGHAIQRSPHALDPSFSRAQVAEITPHGFRGGSDPRTGGGAVALCDG
jgi:gamma-glutamyltranspeptidase/glutathione hydrolase